MSELKHIASSMAMDPLTGPLIIMIFHVASPDADTMFDEVAGMGVLSASGSSISSDVDFIRVFYLNMCFTERQVLETLGLDTSPIVEIVNYPQVKVQVPTPTPKGYQLPITTPVPPPEEKDNLLAVSYDPLRLHSVYTFEDTEYTIVSQVSECLYEVREEE